MINLLNAAHVSKDDQVAVIKIQLTDVARTWWIAEEERLEKLAPYEKFTRAFTSDFSQRLLGGKWNNNSSIYDRSHSGDEYVVEFLWLSQFTQYMVADEEDRANRFQQGLRLDIQKFLITQQLGTYSQVLSAARGLEQIMKKENKIRLSVRPLKRPLDQATRGPPARFSVAPSSKRPISLPPSTMICGICQRMGHLQMNCRWANGQCLACGY